MTADSPDKVSFDFPAAAAYVKAADAATALLGTAKGHAETVAGTDLSGLGTLGTDFAAAWSSAWTSHRDALKTAGAVTDAYGQGLTTWSNVLAGVEDDNSNRIAGAVPGTDQIKA